MTVFTLNVEIDPATLRKLREEQYNLCFAMKCNNEYNVVFLGNTKYTTKSFLYWVDKYEVAAAQDFEANGIVAASTNACAIQPGLSSEFDESGHMGSATGNPDKSSKFSIINKCEKPSSFSVSCELGENFLPFYITPATTNKTIDFELGNTIKMWFSKTQIGGMMISGADGEAYEVEFEGETTDRTVFYDDGEWIPIK